MVDPVMMWVLNALFGVLLTGFGWWVKQISAESKESLAQLNRLEVKIAEEYATRELVEKMELRVVAALAEFKRDIKEELQWQFQHMERFATTSHHKE